MRLVIQRVTEASVTIDGTLYSRIGKGYLVLAGIAEDDTRETAEPLYEYLVEKTREQVPVVEKGVFGADMKVALLNDGPFTILLDSEQM